MHSANGQRRNTNEVRTRSNAPGPILWVHASVYKPSNKSSCDHCTNMSDGKRKLTFFDHGQGGGSHGPQSREKRRRASDGGGSAADRQGPNSEETVGIPLPVPGAMTSPLVLDAAVATAEKWKDNLETYFATYYQDPQWDDSFPMYISSAVVIIALQVELLLAAVNRGEVPNTNNQYELPREIADENLDRIGIFFGRKAPLRDGVRMEVALRRGWTELIESLKRPEGVPCERLTLEEAIGRVTRLIAIGKQYCYKLRLNALGGRVPGSVVLGGGDIVFNELQYQAKLLVARRAWTNL
jgi:hypothetical protein